jgi:hypothetical protein
MSAGGAYGDSVYDGGDAVADAEELDPVENLTGADPDEIMQTGYSPPDREPHHLRDAPTPAELREGESLEHRLASEQPEATGSDDIADERAGRLVAPDEGAHPDREADEIAADVGPAGYASSAEEAAVHVRGEDVENPPGGG